MNPAIIKTRPAVVADLTRLTEIHNHYVVNTPVTFDLESFTPEQRMPWFHEHSDGRRYRMIVAEDSEAGVVGYAASGRFRNKAAYDTTVELSIACSPIATGKGVGKLLYNALLAAIAEEDIHLLVAGITQPNAASNALHKSFGFTPVGTFGQVGRKFGKYWDVLWLQRPLRLG
ncbi:MAG TPA: GNAT family N-acetyltransferase [Alphaproteobacteria bacterium]|nr:GNAT family N-acetyltransferase [Alphaproteobacteria bacterium]